MVATTREKGRYGEKECDNFILLCYAKDQHAKYSKILAELHAQPPFNWSSRLIRNGSDVLLLVEASFFFDFELTV